MKTDSHPSCSRIVEVHVPSSSYTAQWLRSYDQQTSTETGLVYDNLCDKTSCQLYDAPPGMRRAALHKTRGFRIFKKMLDDESACHEVNFPKDQHVTRQLHCDMVYPFTAVDTRNDNEQEARKHVV